MTDETPDDDGSPAGRDHHTADGPDRGTVSLPDRVDFPRLFDFYDFQDAETTQIDEFYDNLREGNLTTTECRSCGATHFPPRIVCPECHSEDLGYVSLPHEGEIFAHTEVRGTHPIAMDGADADGENQAGDDDGREPFVVAVVDLGPVRLSARIDDATHETLDIGDSVALKIVGVDGPIDHERVFYRFKPVEAGADEQ